jgi:hypothetical protein
MRRANGGARGSRQPPGTQIFAWAGLRFHLPAGWETGQLTRDHGWLESDFQPVLEFKTALVKGRFSFRRHLKQLEQTSPLRLQRTDLPALWRSHLKAFQTQAFSWQGPRLAGDGLVIYCPDCRRATLMQFYRTGPARSEITPVLASFDDHGPERRPTVAVYDIQVTVPGVLPLKRFRFDSGRFELVFGDRRRQLTLWRWSPADVALRPHNTSLLSFARQNGLLSGSDRPMAPQTLAQGLEWCWPARRTWRDRLPSRLKRRLSPAILRIWHRKEANRIMAARGDGDLDYATFAEICRSYEIIS